MKDHDWRVQLSDGIASATGSGESYQAACVSARGRLATRSVSKWLFAKVRVLRKPLTTDEGKQ